MRDAKVAVNLLHKSSGSLKCGFSDTFEHPGVNAPGTPNIITFLFSERFDKETLFDGRSSYKSISGILSPT